MSSDSILAIGGEQVPYFRTAEFSSILLECERLVKKFSNAEEDARSLFITGSGTASMEAAVINLFSQTDKLLIINGGSFGQRFADICRVHQIPFEEVKLHSGHTLTEQDLKPFDGQGFTGMLINKHETSTGVHYNMDIVSQYCRRNACLLIVDCISSFLADEFDMKGLQADIMITGSQKALACPPGISIIVLSPRAVDRVKASKVPSLYLDLKPALLDGERGQTPFTPAVGILRQIHARLLEIETSGGVATEIKRTHDLAMDFRSRIANLPFEIYSDSLSNAVTPLYSRTTSAYDIFLILKEQYDIWVCPNGGNLKDKVFRVGHIGALTIKDNTLLINALNDMQRRGFL